MQQGNGGARVHLPIVAPFEAHVDGGIAVCAIAQYVITLAVLSPVPIELVVLGRCRNGKELLIPGGRIVGKQVRKKPWLTLPFGKCSSHCYMQTT